MLSSCGFRVEYRLGLGFMLKEINRLVNKRHHYLSVILTGNIVVLEVRGAGERNRELVSLGHVSRSRPTSNQLERALWWGSW